MPDPLTEIPDRPAFKAAEVCEIAQIPPYVLRSWEKEFPGLGVAGRAGAKVYRRSDVEQVLRIKQLLFSEGLTLAGARRKLEGEPPPAAEPEPVLPVPEEVRTKVATVKRELRSLLDLLSAGPAPEEVPRGEERATAPQPATPASASQVQDAGETAAAAGPPASAPATWPPAPVKPEGREETSLPLLNGTPDGPVAPARSRRSRRPAKG